MLLAEAFCAVYLALLGWALAARDAHLLYRLSAHTADIKTHSKLFGGGVKKLLTTAPAPPQVILFFNIKSTSHFQGHRWKVVYRPYYNIIIYRELRNLLMISATNLFFGTHNGDILDKII